VRRTLGTNDGLAALNLPTRFDVTRFPRQVERYLAGTRHPYHRAILKNYLRHVLLEISGYWDEILVPALTVDEPVYRLGHLGGTVVLTGRDQVERFYRESVEAGKNVAGALTVNVGVEDFGVVTEARWAEILPGAVMREDHGTLGADPGRHYLVTHNISQVFSYGRDAKLTGKRLYDDPASYRYELLAPHDVVTPADARRELASLLARAVILHEADPWTAVLPMMAPSAP